MLMLLAYVFIWIVTASILHVIFEVIRAHDKYSPIPPPKDYKFLGAFIVGVFWPLLFMAAIGIVPYLLWRFVMSKVSFLIQEALTPDKEKSAD